MTTTSPRSSAACAVSVVLWMLLAVATSATAGGAASHAQPSDTLEENESPMFAPVRFTSPTIGWGAGQTGALYRTTDSGKIWTRILDGDEAFGTANTWFFDDTRAAAVRGTYQTGYHVFRTSDGGATWQKGYFPQPTTPKSYAMRFAFSDPEHGWVLVVEGEPNAPAALLLHRTVDGGQTWDIITRTDTTPAPNGLPLAAWVGMLSFKDPSTGWLTGRSEAGPRVLITEDGGKTWRPQHLPATRGLHDGHAEQPFFMSGGTLGFLPISIPLPTPADAPPRAMYSRLLLYLSRDGGRTWASQATLPTVPPGENQAVGAWSPTDWWFAGSNTLWVSTNAGTTWTRRTVPDGEGTLGATIFADGSHAYASLFTGYSAASSRARTFESMDGGATWHPVDVREETAQH